MSTNHRSTCAISALGMAYGASPGIPLNQLQQLLDRARETATAQWLDFDLSLGYLVDLYGDRPAGLALARINPTRGYVRGNVEFVTELVQLDS